MKITDEMFAAARKAYLDGGGDLRAALEAALGQFVLQYGDNIELQEAEQIGFKRSCACIEDLAVALKPSANEADMWDDLTPDQCPAELDGGNGITVGDLRRARAALEKWGLK